MDTTWHEVATEGLPPTRRDVLLIAEVGMRNRRFPLVGRYISAETEEATDPDMIDCAADYDEEQDVYWCPEGWYADTALTGDPDYSWELLNSSVRVTHWAEIQMPEPGSRQPAPK